MKIFSNQKGKGSLTAKTFGEKYPPTDCVCNCEKLILAAWETLKNVKNRSKFHEKMAVFCHFFAMNGKVWVRNKFSTHI